ncbi:hypothetical protein L2E82_48997 [Cichorium intybus]|uniref:Uncharacterized protein n=1 Tax=Cichorium intybus TaxID=13427 RepID=A0ACB8Z0Q6_CICIN|nr:hypothetical protein L2E82_48997 [Cichorium intybus]
MSKRASMTTVNSRKARECWGLLRSAPLFCWLPVKSVPEFPRVPVGTTPTPHMLSQPTSTTGSKALEY